MKRPSPMYATPFERIAKLSNTEFNRQIEEGLRKAPVERAKAVREFWDWICRKI